MNTIILKVLSKLPVWDIVRWLLAEANWQRDVGTWLAAENAWYFRLAATAWGTLYVADPDALRKHILEQVAIGVLTP